MLKALINIVFCSLLLLFLALGSSVQERQIADAFAIEVGTETAENFLENLIDLEPSEDEQIDPLNNFRFCNQLAMGPSSFLSNDFDRLYLSPIWQPPRV